MAEFLTTADMSAEVERVVKRAQHRVVIVSPYLRTRDRIRSLIKERAERGVEVHIVYGKEELHERERGWIDALPSVQLYFHKDLHAKCYMSESAAVLGSMNLYDFSQANNVEMGVLIRAQGDAEVFEDVVEEVERIIREAQERRPDDAVSDRAAQEHDTDQVAEATAATGATDIASDPVGRTAPECPRCGTVMVRRTASTGPNEGRGFWGCPRFPKCRGVLSGPDVETPEELALDDPVEAVEPPGLEASGDVVAISRRQRRQQRRSRAEG